MTNVFMIFNYIIFFICSFFYQYFSRIES